MIVLAMFSSLFINSLLSSASSFRMSIVDIPSLQQWARMKNKEHKISHKMLKQNFEITQLQSVWHTFLRQNRTKADNRIFDTLSLSSFPSRSHVLVSACLRLYTMVPIYTIFNRPRWVRQEHSAMRCFVVISPLWAQNITRIRYNFQRTRNTTPEKHKRL